MRIGILVLMAGRRAGGPETYEVELIRSLAKLDKQNEYVIYCTGPEASEAIAVQQSNVTFRVLQPRLRPISIGVTLPALMVRDGIDFLHSTFTPPPFSSKDLLFTVHCLSSMMYPECFKPAVAMRLNYLLKSGVKKANRLVCVSQYTLDHVHDLFGIERQRMMVSYNGVGNQFQRIPFDTARARIQDVVPPDRPYLLYLGKLQRHKNIVRLLQAYDLYRRATGSQAALLLAGKLAGDSSGIEETIASLQFKDDVIRPGYVASDLVPALYSGARMFVYPSLWEGFGIPLVEAMAAGTPVLTSNVTCLPEIAGGAALTVDPMSVEAIAEGMAILDHDEARRNAMIAAGVERAEFFTWDNCARATLDAYSRMN